jgi:hypothetical protein
VSFRARARMRPVLYPAAILVGFVLNFLVSTGVSPYAAGRPFIVAVAIGVLVPWLVGLVVADRDRAGVIGLMLILTVPAARVPALLVLSLITVVLALVPAALRRRSVRSSAGAQPLRLVTRLLTIGSMILLVAIGINAVQLGRVVVFSKDLVGESPVRPRPVVAEPTPPGAPNMVFILLDGYPRADKLKSEFGIDNSSFIQDLRTRDFVVSDHSRSNETETELTLAQMFNYDSSADIATHLDGSERLWRLDINNGAFFGDLHRLGYETVAISGGFELVALRRADVFIDTGQLNEFEWNMAEMTGLSALADAVLPNLAADDHRARILDTFTVAESQAQSLGARREFLFVHVVSPHSPQVFGATGQPLDVPGFALPYDDVHEISRYGPDEYARRLAGQLAFLNQRTISLVDQVIAADPGAVVVVVFSDHGSGAPSSVPGATPPYPDLRTANLLAVRSPGKSGIIDDRSTLANLLPRLLRAYTGTGPADVPETIYAWTGNPATSFFFDRPD